MVLLYHYTDQAGALGIRRDHRINISTKATDAFFGEGVYLTGMPPQCGRQRIIANNYDSAARLSRNPRLNQRADYYFVMDSENLEEVSKVPIRRDAWLCPGYITYNKAKWDFGSTPEFGSIPEEVVQYYQQSRSGTYGGQSHAWMMLPQWASSRTVVPRRNWGWTYNY